MSQEKVFNHLMVDIETLGTAPNACITSIAAVPFDLATGETGKPFFEQISFESNQKWMRSLTADTLQFWFNQSIEAQKGMIEGLPIWDVLSKFELFLADFFTDNGMNKIWGEIWGNGISFDLAILKNAFAQYGNNEPWPYWAERDVRTLVSLNPSIKDNMPFEGTKHNPLDDCLHQIKYCSETFNSLVAVHTGIKI